MSRSTIFGNDGGRNGCGSSRGAVPSTFDSLSAAPIAAVPDIWTVSPVGGSGGQTRCALASDAVVQTAPARSIANTGTRLGCIGFNAKHGAICAAPYPVTRRAG
jgi:hypothetical protein